jgi:DHA1 family multidrug resistance protein-like MFS transporter
MLANEKKFHDEGIDRPLENVQESDSDTDGNDNEKENEGPHFAPLTTIATVEDNVLRPTSTIRSHLSRTSTRPYSAERFDVEQAIAAEKSKSIVLAPTKTSDGTILVDWYTTDDPSNPQNWSMGKKWLVLLQMAAYSMAVYGASSMYAPAEEGVMHRFHVGATPAALGLAIYVVGYGVGPLLWAPLSEIPAIGRNWGKFVMQATCAHSLTF